MKTIDLEELNENDLKKLLAEYQVTIQRINEILNKKQPKTLSRLENYLTNTDIFSIEFLYRSLNIIPGNNKNGFLTTETLFFLDRKGQELAKKYEISNSKELASIILNRDISNPLFTDTDFIRIINKAKKLIILDEVFSDEDNQRNYKGAYTTYKYIINHLENVLTEENSNSDSEIVYKDYSKKIVLIKENIYTIANELFKLKRETKNGRLAVHDLSLESLTSVKGRNCFTYNQKLLIKCLAFGTTLEKLEDGNYEDAKQLIYSAHK